MPSLYETCNQAYGGSEYAVLQCITNYYEGRWMRALEKYNDWLLILAASLVFFMQTGFATLCAGCVRKKNLQNTMLKNILDACAAAISFYCIGFGLAFGASGNGSNVSFIGSNHFFGVGDINWAVWFFHYACSATTVTIVAGTLAERCRMTAYFAYSLVLTAFVYPIVARAIWSQHGFLSATRGDPLLGSGAVDFSGSGVVHCTGGWTALVASVILGPRKGRFYDIKTGEPLVEPKVFLGHSIGLQLCGTFILWFGWYGFNPGASLLLGPGFDVGTIAARAATNTSIAGSVGAIVAMLTSLFLQENKRGESSYSLTATMNGALSGLVAITGSCAIVEPWGAAVIGLVAGWLYLLSSNLLLRLKIDDVVDAIPVHLVCGLWGVFATGLFASPSGMRLAYHTDEHVGWFYSWGRGSADASLLVCQILAILFIVGWTSIVMIPFFRLLHRMHAFRADNLEELLGLDTVYHGGARDDGMESHPKQQIGHIRRILVEGSMGSNNGEELIN